MGPFEGRGNELKFGRKVPSFSFTTKTIDLQKIAISTKFVESVTRAWQLFFFFLIFH